MITSQMISDFEKRISGKIQETVTSDVAATSSRITTKRREIAPSAASCHELLLDFMLSVDPKSIPEGSRETLYNLYTDLEYDSEHQFSEGILKSKKTKPIDLVRSRKWYANPANKLRVKKKAKLLKKKGIQKKKEILKKSGRNLSGKKKREYHTAGHEKSEAYNFGFADFIKENHIGENIEASADFKRKQKIQEIVESMFHKIPYRVIKSFSIEGVDCDLNEKLELVSRTTWLLTKRNDQQLKFKIDNNKEIMPFLKHEDDVVMEDLL